MRALDGDDQVRLMNCVRAVLRPLALTEGQTGQTFTEGQNSRVIAGNEEALFGWLAASYLRNLPQDGYLEMGGASAQIAFPVAADAQAVDGTRVVQLTIAGVPSRILLASYNLGLDEARRIYDRNLVAADPNPFRALGDDGLEVYVHPCRHSSDQAVTDFLAVNSRSE